MNAMSRIGRRRGGSQTRPYMAHLALAVLLILLLGLAVAVHAQSGGESPAANGGGYDLTWNTVDGGGTMNSQGGGYTLGGTAGQPDAAVWSGGGASPPLSTGYTLAGGFWSAASAGGAPGGSKVYLPIITR